MLCQLCSATNPDDADYCLRCGHKLLVVSGDYTEEDQETFDDSTEEVMSFDEHLLERVSLLEEVLRRTALSVGQMLSTVYKLEQKILLNQSGLTALRDLLEDKSVISHQEWSELYESRSDRELLALEKRERFIQIKERILSLYGGEQRPLFNDLLEQAEHALVGLDIDGALEILDEAMSLDPMNYELSFFLAEAFFNEGRVTEALSFFGRVLLIKPQHFESLVYSGVLHHEAGHDELACRLLERAVSLFPQSFLASFSLGAIHASRGRLREASVYLERATESGDSLPQASYLLGSSYLELGKPGRAIKSLETAVEQDPAFEEAYLLLGLAYLERGWNKKALSALKLGQRLQPSRLDYHELLHFLGGAEESLPAVGDVVMRRLHEAEEAMRGGDVRGALSAYRQSLALDPENPTLLVAYAMACLTLRRAEDIEPVIKKVLQLDPGEPLEIAAWATWIETLRDHGRLRESARIARELLKRVHEDSTRAIASYELAASLAESGDDLDDALEHSRRAAELAPKIWRRLPLGELGWVHYQRGEWDDAVQCLESASDLGTSKRVLTRLGLALLAVKRRDEARAAFERARQLDEERGLKATVLAALKDGARLLQDGVLGAES
ncbi:MAG: tetratricopeptide repeat protein [Acidobacteriota bacterium]